MSHTKCNVFRCPPSVHVGLLHFLLPRLTCICSVMNSCRSNVEIDDGRLLWECYVLHCSPRRRDVTDVQIMNTKLWPCFVWCPVGGGYDHILHSLYLGTVNKHTWWRMMVVVDNHVVRFGVESTWMYMGRLTTTMFILTILSKEYIYFCALLCCSFKKEMLRLSKYLLLWRVLKLQLYVLDLVILPVRISGQKFSLFV